MRKILWVKSLGKIHLILIFLSPFLFSNNSQYKCQGNEVDQINVFSRTSRYYPKGLGENSPVGKDEKVAFVCSTDRYIYALSTKDGRVIWKFKMGGWAAETSIHPLIDKGIVIISGLGVDLYALSTKDGKVLWGKKHKREQGVWRAPYLTEETILISEGYSDSSKIFSFSINQGKEVTSNGFGMLKGYPLGLVDEVLLVHWNSFYKGLNAITGKELWNKQIKRTRSYTGTADTDSFYVAESGRRGSILRKITARDGEIMWKITSKDMTWFSPPVCGLNALYVNEMMMDNSGTRLIALSKSTGERMWEVNFTEKRAPNLALGQHEILSGSEDGNMYCFSLKEGALLWKYHTNGIVKEGAALAREAAYFGSADKTVYAINLKTGSLLWKYKTGGAITAAISIAD